MTHETGYQLIKFKEKSASNWHEISALKSLLQNEVAELFMSQLQDNIQSNKQLMQAMRNIARMTMDIKNYPSHYSTIALSSLDNRKAQSISNDSNVSIRTRKIFSSLTTKLNMKIRNNVNLIFLVSRALNWAISCAYKWQPVIHHKDWRAAKTSPTSTWANFNHLSGNRMWQEHIDPATSARWTLKEL